MNSADRTAAQKSGAVRSVEQRLEALQDLMDELLDLLPKSQTSPAGGWSDNIGRVSSAILELSPGLIVLLSSSQIQGQRSAALASLQRRKMSCVALLRRLRRAALLRHFLLERQLDRPYPTAAPSAY